MNKTVRFVELLISSGKIDRIIKSGVICFYNSGNIIDFDLVATLMEQKGYIFTRIVGSDPFDIKFTVTKHGNN